MPLCEVCKYEALHQGNYNSHIRDPTFPPWGMEWGQTCSACKREASVIIETWSEYARRTGEYGE